MAQQGAVSAVENGHEDEAGMPPVVATAKFTAADVLHDPRLAEAALQELHSGRALSHSSNSRHGSFKQQGSFKQPAAPAVEELVLMDGHLSKIMETAESLDEGVQEESQVNCELAQIIIKQLESSRRELEALADTLTALLAAERAYTMALGQAQRSKARRQAPANKAPTSPAASPTADTPPSPTSPTATQPPSPPASDHARDNRLSALCQLTSVLLPIHQEVTSSLMPIHRDVQHLVVEYQRACKEVGSQAQSVAKAVELAREGLYNAFEQHKDATNGLRSTLQQRVSGTPAVSPEVDPWAMERRLVQELRQLQRCQDKERSFLRTAFSHARELEMHRNQCVHKVLSSLSHSYVGALEGVLARVKRATLHHNMNSTEHDCMNGSRPSNGGSPAASDEQGDMADSTLLQELTRAAETASEATAALAARMAESIQAVSTELFCSPEIVRQGELQSWSLVQHKWIPGHAVLTRAGFLYFFNLAADGSPGTCSGELNLTKLQFEAGQAPCFHLVSEPHGLAAWTALLTYSRGRTKLSFQASTVEDGCEWAIAIREAIALACGKQAD